MLAALYFLQPRRIQMHLFQGPWATQPAQGMLYSL
jgi:hypothetical protein